MERTVDTLYAFRATVPVPGLPKYRQLFFRDLLPAPAWHLPEWAEQTRQEYQAKRVRGAAYLTGAALDPARCRFTKRSMTLVGTIPAQSVRGAVDAVLTTINWSLKMIYDVQVSDSFMSTPLADVGLDVRPARTRAASQGAVA